jgi:glycosyltransferase involved in cell wall biosynthesis
MRVVHVASGRLFGGIEQMLATLARTSAPAGMQAAFAIAAPGRLEDELAAANAALLRLGDVRLSRPASLVQGRVRLARLLETSRPDVAVFHAPWAHAIFAPVARRRGVPVVFWQHDHAAGRGWIERWARRTPADLVICNSRWTMASASALQPSAPATVVHPPVPSPSPATGDRDAIRRELSTSASDVVLLTASRLEPWKGHRHLVGALAEMASTPGWTWWIAGGAHRPHEQAYLESLRAEIGRRGLESRARFLGERRDVARLMTAADVYCQVNDGPEPFGIVFAEALWSGLPVVAADIGGTPELVSPGCGRLVPRGDRPALVAALRELVADAGLRSGLGAAGPAQAARICGPDVVLPRLAGVLSRFGASAAA